MKKYISMLSLLLFLIPINSVSKAQQTDLLATEVLVPTYDNKFLVGIKYNDAAQRFKIKSVYDKRGKKLEGMFAGYVNPVAAECMDLKRLSVATKTGAVWNLEQDLLEDSKSTSIISQTDGGAAVHYKSAEEIEYGYGEIEGNRVYLKLYLSDEGTMVGFTIIKEGKDLLTEVAILKVNEENILLKEGGKPREVPNYETQSGGKHLVKAIRDAEGKLQVVSNYFGEFEPVLLENFTFNLVEFMRSK